MKRLALAVALICSALLSGCIIVPARGHGGYYRGGGYGEYHGDRGEYHGDYRGDYRGGRGYSEPGPR